MEAMEIEHTVGQFIMDSISYSIPHTHTHIHTLVTDMYRLQDLVFDCTSVGCRDAGKQLRGVDILHWGVYRVIKAHQGGETVQKPEDSVM